ncbi:MAG: nuclear transport factor 2 family protein [Eggerthellaceae bacterium]|nr:nuclear transport factor 2 family protein [Eggerthellaceae bacterium]
MTDEEQILEAYERMYAAMVAKDMDVLDEVLDESMVLVHMTGSRQSKQQYMHAIADGTLNYFAAETENVEIAIDGDHATMTGQSHVEAVVYGSGRGWWHLQLAMKLVRRNGAWRFTEARASTY